MDAPDLTDAEALTFLRGQMAALEEPPTALQLNTWLEQSCRRGFFECVGFLVEERGVAPEDHVPLTEAYTSCFNERVVLFLLSLGAPVNPPEEGTDGPLHIAARRGDGKMVERLVNAGANVNLRGEAGYTPVHAATANNMQNTVKQLLAMGADMNAANSANATPLETAVDENRPLLVEILLKAGCDTAQINNAEKDLLNGLIKDGRSNLFRLLLDHGGQVDVNARELMHNAATHNQLSIMQILIEAGADITALDETFGAPPLFHAAKHNHHQAIDLLLQAGADINDRDYRGDTVLHVCLAKDADTVRKLIACGADLEALESCNRTPLYVACQENLIDVALILLEAGADVNATCYEAKLTPLHTAAEHNHVKIMRVLLEAGAVVDAHGVSYQQDTPLLLACIKGHHEAIGLLLEAGCDINVRHRDNGTILHAGFVYSSSIVQTLIGLGIDIDALNDSGETALYLACEKNNGDMARLLIKGGADVHVHCSQRQRTALHCAAEANSLQIIELLLDAGADVESLAENDSVTALVLACRKGSIEAVRMLLANGANVNAVSAVGRTALHEACTNGRPDVVSLLLDQEGIEVDAASPLGGNDTPLHLACSLGHADIVELLLARGAQDSLRNQNGSTPREMAWNQHVLLIFAGRGA